MRQEKKMELIRPTKCTIALPVVVAAAAVDATTINITVVIQPHKLQTTSVLFKPVSRSLALRLRLHELRATSIFILLFGCSFLYTVAAAAVK